MTSLIGTIFDIKRFAVHDGPGIRTTVFFKGCPLSCWWCHNPESQNSQLESILRPNSEEVEVVGRKISVHEVMEEIKKDLIFYDQSGGGVTISGGEPLMQPEFLLSLLTECNLEHIHTTIDTTGYGSVDLVKSLLDKTDMFLYDLKFIDDTKHQEYTGVSNKTILQNLKYLDTTTKAVRIRIPIIPNVTDTQTNIHDLGNFLSTDLQTKFPVDILPYNRLGEGKYPRLNRSYHFAQQLKTPSDKELNIIKKQLESYRLDVHVGG